MKQSARHAYCIIAHEDPELLSFCVSLLDDSRNDIYIHIDAKEDISRFDYLKTRFSSLFFSDRIRVNWGGISQVAVELLLLETARKHSTYARYHVISGVDLPIKTQDYIHDFCTRHRSAEFLSLPRDVSNLEDLRLRTEYRYILTEHYRDSNKILRHICSFIRNLTLGIQKKLGLKRSYRYQLAKMSNWFSCTEGFCEYLISQKDWILRTFRHVHAPDEIAIASVFVNSPFARNLYSSDPGIASMREIDWTRGTPYVWQYEDRQRLKQSPCFFARKFSSKDRRLLLEIKRWVLPEGFSDESAIS